MLIPTLIWYTRIWYTRPEHVYHLMYVALIGGVTRDVIRDSSSDLDRVSTISRILRGCARDRNKPGRQATMHDEIHFRRALGTLSANRYSRPECRPSFLFQTTLSLQMRRSHLARRAPHGGFELSRSRRNSRRRLGSLGSFDSFD